MIDSGSYPPFVHHQPDISPKFKLVIPQVTHCTFPSYSKILSKKLDMNLLVTIFPKAGLVIQEWVNLTFLEILCTPHM